MAVILYPVFSSLLGWHLWRKPPASPKKDFNNQFLTLARLRAVAVEVRIFRSGSYFVSCP